MCTVAIPLIAAGIGAAATVYSAHEAKKDAAAAREQQEKQMQQQIQLAKEQQSQPAAITESAKDVTAAVQSNRRRAGAMAGMGSTITGAGLYYNDNTANVNNASKFGYGTKKTLGA